MHGTICIFWVNLAPFSPQYYVNAFGAPVGLNVSVQLSGGGGNGLRLAVGAVSISHGR
jgi:hypothetical protein